MSYFNLRKREPEDETDTVEEELDEVGEEREPDVEEESAPTSWGGAIWCGIKGPSAWLTDRTNIEASLLLHAFTLWAVWTCGGWIAAGVVALWLLAVLAFVPPEYKERATSAVERLTNAIERYFTPARKPAAIPVPGGEREAVRRLLLDIIGDAHGVHLKTVLAHLQEHGQWEGRKVADLRVHLEALGIPVDPKLKVGKVPTRGVLRAALEALPPVEETSPSPAPSPPV